MELPPWWEAEEEAPATLESGMPPEKPSLLCRADRKAAELRERAGQAGRKVVDKVDVVTHSDAVVCSTTVIAVPFFFSAPRSGQ